MKVLKCILIPLTLIFFSCGSEKVNNKTLNIKGAYDNVETIVIGDLEWMIEDLKVTHYRNGDPIDEIDKGVNHYEPGRVGFNYNNMAIDDPRGLVPAGWRIPSMNEWKNLIDVLNNGVNLNIDNNKLKSCFPLSSITPRREKDGNGVILFAFKHYMSSSFDVDEWEQNKRKHQENMKYIRDGEIESDEIIESVDMFRRYESIWLWTKNENFDSIAPANGTLMYPGRVIKCVRRVRMNSFTGEPVVHSQDTAEEVEVAGGAPNPNYPPPSQEAAIEVLKKEYEYLEAKFIDFSFGDFAYYTFQTKNGVQYDFNGIKDSSFDEEADHEGKYFHVFYKSEEFVDPEHGPYTSEIIYRIIEESSIAVPVAEFNLISSNKSQSAVTRIPFIADYKIELLIGNTIIDVFEDFGYAYISDDKTYIEISTDAGSNRSYWFELDEFGQLIVTKHYSFSDMDIDEDTWIKTYKNINNWKLISCKGECK